MLSSMLIEPFLKLSEMNSDSCNHVYIKHEAVLIHFNSAFFDFNQATCRCSCFKAYRTQWQHLSDIFFIKFSNIFPLSCFMYFWNIIFFLVCCCCLLAFFARPEKKNEKLFMSCLPKLFLYISPFFEKEERRQKNHLRSLWKEFG